MSKGRDTGRGRRVEPELLDSLPPEDPQAVRSRRDLRRVNAWMGNARVLSHAVSCFGSGVPPKRIAEIGAGDGTFVVSWMRRLADRWPGVTLELIDRQAVLAKEAVADLEAAGWRVHFTSADVFDWVKQAGPFDLIVTNLFLHHFENDRLVELFSRISAKTNAFAACEPRRFRFPRLAGQMVALIGCSAITRHDAAVSVAGGFSGQELSGLWPAKDAWELRETDAGLFSHLFQARVKRGEADVSQGCSSSGGAAA